MKWIMLVVSFCFSIQLSGAEVSAIICQSKAILTVKDVDRVEFEMFKKVEVLSQKGSYHSQLVFHEDNFRRAIIYSVTVKDKDGGVIAQYNKNDFKKTAIIQATYSYDNINQFYLDCGLKNYPYSIEIHSLIQSDIFFEKGYDLSENEGTSLLESSFEVFYPQDYHFRYQLNRPDLVLVDSATQNKNKILRFFLQKGYENSAEPYMPESDRPIIYIVPETFKYGNLTGSFNSWNQYGAWINLLWEGRYELSKTTTEAIDRLIEANTDKTDLARAIYQHTQQNMRYVSITLGLGGMQTMSAKETAKLGYGDCKALSNVTAAAMNYAGIEAYPALVYGGERSNRIDPDMPRFSFNHVILCLPAISDTTWLECTSNTAPFGYISNFTDDRYAMILKPSGGVLVKTPSFSASANEAIRKISITLRSNGSAAIQLSCKFRNLAMNNSNFYQRELTGDKPIKAVKREINLPSFDLESYSSELYKAQEPVLDISCSLEGRNVGRRVGDKLLVKPFLIQTSIPSLNSDSVRIHPVFFKHGFTFSDTISIILPNEMTILEPLIEMEQTNNYGHFSLKSNWDETEGKLEIIRAIRLNGGEFKPEEYAELTKFLDQVRASKDLFFILH